MRDSSGIKIICAQLTILLPEVFNKFKKMKQNIRYSVFGALATIAMMLFAPNLVPNAPYVEIVQAQSSACTNGTGTGVDCPNEGLTAIQGAFPGSNRAKDLPTLVKVVINWALYLSAIVAVIFIIIGGFMYITSAGNESQATKGRTTLINALIGLVIVVLSYMLVQVVYNFISK